jgi:hypothetical protein
MLNSLFERNIDIETEEGNYKSKNQTQVYNLNLNVILK